MRIPHDANQLSHVRADLHEWIRALPVTLTFQTQDGPLLLCHGLGEDDMARLASHHWPCPTYLSVGGSADSD